MAKFFSSLLGVRSVQKKGDIDPNGYDVDKKINGKKRHIPIEYLLHAFVHPSGIQDKGRGALSSSKLFGMYPLIRKMLVDADCQALQYSSAVAPILDRHFQAIRSGARILDLPKAVVRRSDLGSAEATWSVGQGVPERHMHGRGIHTGRV